MTSLLFPGLAAITVVLVLIPCSAHCPETWEHFQGDCYKFFRQRKFLVGYIEFCRKFGAEVLEIRSTAENEFITRYLETFGYTGEVWLGIGYRDGHWKYFSNNKKITYTHWARGQPDRRYYSAEGEQDCVIFATDGHWHDFWCSWYPYYYSGVCRMPMK